MMTYKINYTCLSTNSELLKIDNSTCRLIYIAHGTKIVILDGNEINYNQGEILYIRKNCTFLYTNVTDNDKYEEFEILYTLEELRLIMDNFVTKFNNEKFAKLAPQGYTESIISQNIDNSIGYFYKNLLLLIKDDFISQDHQIEWTKRSEFMFLLTNSKLSSIVSNIVFDIRMPKNNIIKIVTENIYNKISIVELSKMCGMSVSTFKKEFAEYYKQSPHKWFIEQRLNKAKFLLVSTDKDIQQTANECCFENTSHFIKLFKRKYNLTPLKYRNVIKLKG
ncbi:MAG: AraC family transcriptional regulator [Rikenellaceae bacterium]